MNGSNTCAPRAADAYGTLPCGGGIMNGLTARAFEDRIYNIEITVAPADFDRLNQNAENYDGDLLIEPPRAATYIPAMVKIDGVDLGMVGFRYKGAWGTFRTCLNPPGAGGKVPPTPVASCTNQFSAKIAFDQYDMMKKWNGLKKINLHSHIRDASKMREKLSLKLFRDMGIATARSTHAKVTLNVGGASVVMMYGLAENVGDGRWTEDHFPMDQNGNMWKQMWPRSLWDGHYTRRLETNTDPPPPATIYSKPMAWAMEVYRNWNSPDVLLASVQKWSDLDWLARYLAVDTVSTNVDSVTKFWARQPALPGPLTMTNMENSGPNNYFWYQLIKQDKFLLIPWDVDFTWYESSACANKDDPGGVASERAYKVPLWDTKVPSCTTPYPQYGADHMAPSCDPIFKGLNLPAFKERYFKAIRDMLAGPLDVPRMHADIDKWASYYKPALMTTTNGVLGGITINGRIDPARFDAGIAELKKAVEFLAGRIAGVPNGQPFRVPCP